MLEDVTWDLEACTWVTRTVYLQENEITFSVHILGNDI